MQNPFQYTRQKNADVRTDPEPVEQHESGIHAEHDRFTVEHVDYPHDTEDHGEPYRQKGVNETDQYAVYND